MNFLGIGPGELFLIVILLLVVVGPERLPGMARQAGRLLVTARNWLQTSPDAALVLRARQEIEQELLQLRTSLLEVQNVRNEVIDVARQIDEAVSPIAHMRPPSLSDLINPPAEPTFSVSNAGQTLLMTEDQAAAVPPADAQGGADIETTPAEAAAVDAAPEPAPAIEGMPELAPMVAQNGTTPAEVGGNGATRPPTAAEIDALGLRIQAVMADLFALQEQLKQRGLLAGDWQPPSHEMQLPQPNMPMEEAEDERN
jgi:sec-independent protein translocase protein TatB